MAANRPVQIVDVQAVSNSRAANNSSDLVVATTRKTTASGDLALNIKPVSDYNVKKIRFRVRYPSTETGFKTSDYITIPLHQYNLAIASDKSEIVGDDTAKVTVSGGKPGETVAWSNTGSGKILDGKSTTFDAQGNAYATVQGIAPFTGTVKLLANNNISANLTVKRIENLNYYIFLPRDGVVNHCGKTITQDFQFSLSPYIEAGLIKSITVKSKFDDVGYASINGISVGSCTNSGCNISEITIDVSNLKSNNKLYMSASDIRFFDCSFINNATDAKVQITINYK